MPRSRRNVLQNATSQATTHAGLWLDKYYDASSETEKSKPPHELVKQVAKINVPPSYLLFYNRWVKNLQRANAQMRIARVNTRLAINLGTESVLETSIALHHTYGVPYIPGSALKGLAASFAHQHLDGDEWRKESGWAHKELFGTTEQAGCVTFFDALYRPPEYFQQGKPITPLRPDIITVHHPEYYRGEDTPPSDWDSPTPIPFLTATGKYLFAISGPEEWVNVTFDILEHALEAKGIGAKTSSGYGRMSFVDDTPSVKMPLVKEFSPTRMPAPNDRFKGIVFDWDSKGVYLEIPGLDPDDFWAFIPASEYPSEHRFQSGQRIKCVVTKVNGDEIVCALD